MGTSSVLSIEVFIYATGIMVDDPLEWLALPVESKKRMCNSFNNCMITFYECLYTRIWLQVPFSDFEVAILKH